jgi:hypothetical protein
MFKDREDERNKEGHMLETDGGREALGYIMKEISFQNMSHRSLK